jgi:MOSC domain-containing protein YiiM
MDLDFMNNYPQPGHVTWIGVRPEKLLPMISLSKVKVLEYKLEGDHYKGNALSKRNVTLIQQEHVDAIASFLSKDIDPGLLRRNIVVKGINLLALKDKRFQLGEACFEMTGLCLPCSKMEKTLGPGGYNAMRGHGGITAKIIRTAIIKVGDTVSISS